MTEVTPEEAPVMAFDEMVTTQEQAKRLVLEFFNEKAEAASEPLVSMTEIVVAMFDPAVPNWSALVVVRQDDYYKVTYNSDESSARIDTYASVDNTSVVVPPADAPVESTDPNVSNV